MGCSQVQQNGGCLAWRAGRSSHGEKFANWHNSYISRLLLKSYLGPRRSRRKLKSRGRLDLGGEYLVSSSAQVEHYQIDLQVSVWFIYCHLGKHKFGSPHIVACIAYIVGWSLPFMSTSSVEGEEETQLIEERGQMEDDRAGSDVGEEEEPGESHYDNNMSNLHTSEQKNAGLASNLFLTAQGNVMGLAGMLSDPALKKTDSVLDLHHLTLHQVSFAPWHRPIHYKYADHLYLTIMY